MDGPSSELRLLPGVRAAYVLSGVIGWERERRRHRAGLRIHILVGVSAALFVLLGGAIVKRFGRGVPQVLFDLIGMLGSAGRRADWPPPRVCPCTCWRAAPRCCFTLWRPSPAAAVPTG